MSCWEKSASLFLIFLFLLLVCNSLGHVANRPDYHVNLILPYRFFDNLRPQSYLKASVFFLGEAILTKAWTEGPRVAKVYIFCRKSHHIWKERGSHSEAETLQGVPEVHASFNLIKYFILVVPSFDSKIWKNPNVG